MTIWSVESKRFLDKNVDTLYSFGFQYFYRIYY